MRETLREGRYPWGDEWGDEGVIGYFIAAVVVMLILAAAAVIGLIVGSELLRNFGAAGAVLLATTYIYAVCTWRALVNLDREKEVAVGKYYIHARVEPMSFVVLMLIVGLFFDGLVWTCLYYPRGVENILFGDGTMAFGLAAMILGPLIVGVAIGFGLRLFVSGTGEPPTIGDWR